MRSSRLISAAIKTEKGSDALLVWSYGSFRVCWAQRLAHGRRLCACGLLNHNAGAFPLRTLDAVRHSLCSFRPCRKLVKQLLPVCCGRLIIAAFECSRAGNHKRKWFAGIKSKRSEEHTSELQYLMRISYAVFCLKK